MREKFNPIIKDDAVYYSVLLILIAVIAFGLGRYSVSLDSHADYKDMSPIVVNMPPATVSGVSTSSNSDSASQIIEKNYVASKKGAKYHHLWCPGAGQIKEENKIYFATKEEAERFGYTPAANCPDL